MINKQIELKDLEIGDIVLVSGLDLRALEILRKPSERPKSAGYSRINYKAIKCLERNDLLRGTKTYPNKEIYYDFNYKGMWLINKKDRI